MPSFTLLLTVNMVYDILAKAKNLFIRFLIAIALLLHILIPLGKWVYVP